VLKIIEASFSSKIDLQIKSRSLMVVGKAAAKSTSVPKCVKFEIISRNISQIEKDIPFTEWGNQRLFFSIWLN
jgi:hypothetical protein